MTSNASPAAPSETQQQTERWRGVALDAGPVDAAGNRFLRGRSRRLLWSLLRPYRRWLVAMVGIVLRGERGQAEHPVARGPRHRRRPAADHGRGQPAYVARDRRRHARRRHAPVARTDLVPPGLRPRRAGRPAGAAPPGLHSLPAARRRFPRPLHLRPRHVAPDQRRRRHHRAAGGRLRRVGHRRTDHGRRRGADDRPGPEAGAGLPDLFSVDAAAGPVVRPSLSGRLPPGARAVGPRHRAVRRDDDRDPRGTGLPPGAAELRDLRRGLRPLQGREHRLVPPGRRSSCPGSG